VRKFMRVVRMPSRAVASYGALSPVSRRIAWMHKRFACLKSGPRFVSVRPAAVFLRACAMASLKGADTS
jgi:hypothetical protein